MRAEDSKGSVENMRLSAIVRFPARLFSASIGVVLVLVVAVSPFVDYITKAPLTSYGVVFLLAALLIGIIIVVLVRLSSRRLNSTVFYSDRGFFVTVFVLSLVLFAVQVYIVNRGFFTTDWDVAVLTDFGAVEKHVGYYERYPNQFFLSNLFALIANVGGFFGVEGYRSVVLVGCLSVVCSVLMCSLAAKKIGGYSVGYASFALAAVFVGLSPWILVPYSDTYAMPWIMLAVLAYVCNERSPLKWSLIVLASIIGYSIKPTVIFIFIAILFVGFVTLCRTFRMREMLSLKATSKTIASVVCVAVIALCGVNAMKTVNAAIDDEQAFGATHFLMMGFNYERNGVWSGDDVVFSNSFDSRADRQRANLEVWQKRVKNLGVAGVSKLFVKKTLANYADGTLSWECEGKFYIDMSDRDSWVKHFYGISYDGGKADNLFAFPFQIIWMLVLSGIVFLFAKKGLAKEECAISLALIMLSVFLTLFECRGRYLLLYMPCFVFLSVLGWKAVGRLAVDAARNTGVRAPKSRFYSNTGRLHGRHL